MKRYVARVSDSCGRMHDFNLSPSFSTIAECQHYIDTNATCILIENYLHCAFNKILWNHYVNDNIDRRLSLFGSFVRVYDLEQKRFIDSFDI